MAPHLRKIDKAIEDLVLRRIPERVLVIRMPPRHGKSELISHWTPTWFEANWPDKNTLLASYEANFAAGWGRKSRDDFSDVVRRYGAALPGRPALDRQSVADWGTTAGGYMASGGVGGPFTGKGFHLGVCDDLVKNDEEAQSETYREKTWSWFTSTFWTRCEPGGVLICIGTPWHRDDWLGRMRKWDEPIVEINLPAVCNTDDDALGREQDEALWPERFDREQLRSIELAQGRYYWHALYQCDPQQHEGAEFPTEYFEDIFTDRWPDAFEMSTVAIDPSKGRTDKADYSAIVFAGLAGGKIYVDVDMDRRPAPQIIEDSARMCIAYRSHDSCVEAEAFQELLAPDFDRHARRIGLPMPQMELLENHGVNKIVRIRRLGGYLAGKRILFRNTAGSRLCIEQLKDFPLGDYDDGPDGVEMAIRRLQIIASEMIENETGMEQVAM